jgi:hypothetical protein
MPMAVSCYPGENVAIVTRNLETLEKPKRDSKIFENGLTEEEDVEQLQIPQLTNQLNSAKRQTEIAMNMFQLALGIDLFSCLCNAWQMIWKASP